MADDQQGLSGNGEPKNKEASATDLLSLWGAASPKIPEPGTSEASATKGAILEKKPEKTPNLPVELAMQTAPKPGSPPPASHKPASHKPMEPHKKPLEPAERKAVPRIPAAPLPQAGPPVFPKKPSGAPVVPPEPQKKSPETEYKSTPQPHAPPEHKPEHKTSPQPAVPHPKPPPAPKPLPEKTPPWMKKIEEEAERAKPELQAKPKIHHEAQPQIFEGEIVEEKHAKKEDLTKKVREEPISEEKAEGEEPEFLPEDESFGQKLDEFLQELHLSRKHIWYGVGCIVFLVVFVWGALQGYDWYKNRKKPISEAPTSESSQEKSPADAVKIAPDETGLESSSQFGKTPFLAPSSIGNTGIEATDAIGTEAVISSTLGKYLIFFKRIQNAYATNVDELLNKSLNRRASLKSHIAVLKKLHDDGVKIMESIQKEMDIIKIQYDPQREKQQTTDANFFEQLNAFNPETSQNILNEFIGASREVVSLRARFQALQKVKSFYGQGLPKLAARIKDIELNEEALVRGIKVYDVKGSDLKLVVPVPTGLQDEQSLSRSPAFPLLPVRPPQVKGIGGKDFVTQPGGGF